MSNLFSNIKNYAPGKIIEEKYSGVRHKILKILRLILVFTAILAITSIIAQFGFYISPSLYKITSIINDVVLYIILIQFILRTLLDDSPKKYIKNHPIEVIIILIIIFYLLSPSLLLRAFLLIDPNLTPETITYTYIIFTQLLVISRIIIGLVSYSRKFLSLNIQPSLLIVISFLFLILTGTFLLLLPKASHTGLSFIDALFTSTSAVCVTGLIVTDTALTFTPTGHTIIIFLIQIGGLGIMTLTTFITFFMGGATKLKEYTTIQSIIGEDNIGKIKYTLISIAFATLIIETVGVISLYYFLNPAFFLNNHDRLMFSIFHSISAFCNAGFSLTSNNFMQNELRFDYGLQSTIMILIILGGLGFPVISNLFRSIISKINPYGIRGRLNAHSKIVLMTTLILILSGAIILFFTERARLLINYSFDQQILASLFHSVSSRTAGFNSYDIGGLSIQSSIIIMILMWIGASPASTGGGVKTTTIALAFLNIRAIFSGREHVEAFKKRISDISNIKAFSTIILSLGFIFSMLFLLTLTENFKFEDLLFELFSAVGTVGLSRGITPFLSDFGKIIIVLSMFVGRVGLFTFVLVMIKRKTTPLYEYTQENILIT